MKKSKLYLISGYLSTIAITITIRKATYNYSVNTITEKYMQMIIIIGKGKLIRQVNAHVSTTSF